MSLQRYAIVLSYCGEKYAGWQTQPDGNTVQDRLEKAISVIASEKINVVCAGRTDAGVHATAQVCHADLPSARPATAWVRGVNGLLEQSIQVQSVHPVSKEFNARFSATERCYRYVLYRAQVLNPLLNGRAARVFRPLNTISMQQAAAIIIGEHDFSTFRSSQCQAKTPIRTLKSIDFHEQGDLLIIQFRANAFLHHMIRNIVGALVEVGTQKRDLVWFQQMFNARDRKQGALTFSPEGLYFCGVSYSKGDAPESLRRACEPSALNRAQWWT
jgi:tRNA pseudouridine38-40 synthase